MYFRGAGCISEGLGVFHRGRLYFRGTGCISEGQVVLQRGRLYPPQPEIPDPGITYTFTRMCA